MNRNKQTPEENIVPFSPQTDQRALRSATVELDVDAATLSIGTWLRGPAGGAKLESDDIELWIDRADPDALPELWLDSEAITDAAIDLAEVLYGAEAAVAARTCHPGTITPAGSREALFDVARVALALDVMRTSDEPLVRAVAAAEAVAIGQRADPALHLPDFVGHRRRAILNGLAGDQPVSVRRDIANTLTSTLRALASEFRASDPPVAEAIDALGGRVTPVDVLPVAPPAGDEDDPGAGDGGPGRMWTRLPEMVARSRALAAGGVAARHERAGDTVGAADAWLRSAAAWRRAGDEDEAARAEAFAISTAERSERLSKLALVADLVVVGRTAGRRRPEHDRPVLTPVGRGQAALAADTGTLVAGQAPDAHLELDAEDRNGRRRSASVEVWVSEDRRVEIGFVAGHPLTLAGGETLRPDSTVKIELPGLKPLTEELADVLWWSDEPA